MGLEAEIFKWLRDSVCPKAFKFAKAEYKDAVVIDDLLTFLHRLWTKDGLFTGIGVFHEVAIRVQQMWESGAQVYVACMDIQQLMPSAKFPEQASRDADRKVGSYPNTATVNDYGLNLNDGLPERPFQLKTILASRNGARESLFNYLGRSFAYVLF
jgi:hypothetical protein